jgi:hypothetical protein
MKEERGYLYVINKTHGRFFKYFKIYVYFKIYYETSFPLSKITEWNMIIYDLDVILHVFMLQDIFTTGFRGMNITEKLLSFLSIALHESGTRKSYM